MAVVALGLVATSSSARADGRDGLTFGASFGRGSIDVECGRCDHVDAITEALSLTAHVGFMLTPRLALVGEHWTVRWRDRGSEWFDDSLDHLVAQRITVIGAQAWLTRRLWVKAGLGVGYHISDSDYVREGAEPAGPRPAALASGSAIEDDRAPRATPAYFTAIGWEYAHTETFSCDVQIRVGATRRPADEYQIYNTGLNFGFNWY